MSSGDDFETSDDIFEALGEILREVSVDKTDNDIKDLCDKFHTILRAENEVKNSKTGKILDAPIQLGQMSANLSEFDIDNMTSIWIQQRNDVLVSQLDLWNRQSL